MASPLPTSLSPSRVASFKDYRPAIGGDPRPASGVLAGAVAG